MAVGQVKPLSWFRDLAHTNAAPGGGGPIDQSRLMHTPSLVVYGFLVFLYGVND